MMYIAKGVAKRYRELRAFVVSAFIANYKRPTDEIAEECGATTRLAEKIRAELEANGTISKWRSKRKPVTAGLAAREELLRDCRRTDAAIAEACGRRKGTVRRARQALEADGAIERYRGGANGEKTIAIRAELLRDCKRPNLPIAIDCNATDIMVATVRHKMEKGGELPRWRGTENGEVGYTYFAQAKTLGLIKIGKTIRRERRLPLLYSQSPDEIQMLGIVRGAEVENDLHRRLKSFVHHHEWFNPTPEVLQAIEECIANDANGGSC